MNKHQKNRGIFLVTMLSIYILLVALRLLTLIAPSRYPFVYEGGPDFSYAFNAAIFLLAVFGLVEVFRWHKWGLYVLVGTTLTSIVFDLVYFPEQLPMWSHLLDLVPIGLLSLAVARKWTLFS